MGRFYYFDGLPFQPVWVSTYGYDPYASHNYRDNTLFQLLQAGTYSTLLIAYVVLAWLHSGVSGVMTKMLGDVFPRKTRGLGMDLAYSLSAILFGSTAPLLNNIGIIQNGLLIFSVLYVVAMGLVVLLMVSFLKTEKVFMS